jgi:hypothetical protein
MLVPESIRSLSLCSKESSMKATLTAALMITAVLGVSAHAQTAVPAPATVTGTCRDGSSYSGASRQGACSHHGGVQAFNVPAQPGQVWVNSRSKVYHCPGDRYFGKTKEGSYMSEAAAKAAGDRPDHGKACS